MRFEGMLEGNGIFLRQMNTSDITPEFMGWLHDPEVNKFLDVRHNLPDLNKQLAYVEQCSSSPNKIYFGIFRSESFLIGSSTISVHNGEKVEIGIMIGDKSSLGRGFGSEAVGLLIQWAKQAKFVEITAGYSLENIASAKLFARHGFKTYHETSDSSTVGGKQDIVRTSLSLRA